MASIGMENLKLYKAGVGILASPHVPRIITNEFLVSEEIIGKDWILSNSHIQTSSAQSHIEFRNGVTFFQNGELLRITEQCESEFQDDYVVFEVAAAYLDKAQGNIYGCGVDLDMWILHDEPAAWISEQMLFQGNTTFLQDLSGVSIDFEFQMRGEFEGGNLQLAFGAGTINNPNAEERSILDVRGLIQFYNEEPNTLRKRIEKQERLHDCILNKLRSVLER